MKWIVSETILKKSFCLIAIFIAYPFLQMNTYSNENHSIDINRVEQNNIPIFLEIENDLFINYIINPNYYKLAFDKEALIPSKEISSSGILNELQLAEFLNTCNSHISLFDAFQFASDYIKQCKIEGINHDIAFAQMCLETGFLKYGGSVLPDQNNFCGLGAVNKNCAGESFKNKEIGIIAHVQHLKAYVSTDKLNSPLVDTRFKYVKRGSVKTIYDLTGKWASDPEYGKKIDKLLLRMFSLWR
jgi:hypothetical protein